MANTLEEEKLGSKVSSSSIRKDGEGVAGRYQEGPTRQCQGEKSHQVTNTIVFWTDIEQARDQTLLDADQNKSVLP